MKRTLIIKGRLDGLNEYTRACRAYKMAGAQMKKRNERIITAYIQQQLKGFRIDGQAELHFRWYEKNKKRDLDNICMGKKFILDALVSNGVLIADGWKGVKGFTDTFFIDKEFPRIEVDIMKAGEKDE